MADPARVRPNMEFREASAPAERPKQGEGSGDAPGGSGKASEPTAVQTTTKEEGKAVSPLVNHKDLKLFERYVFIHD